MSQKYHHLTNIEAEQALLGACLINNHALLLVVDILPPDAFSDPLHVRTYAAMLRHQAAGKTFTPVTLKGELEPDWDDSAGLTLGAYLSGLAGSALSVISPREYAEVIADLAAKRALAIACNEALAALESDADRSAHELAGDVQGAVMKVSEMAGQPLFESRRDVIERIVQGMTSERLPCYSTGLSRLDEAMGGGLYAKKVYGMFARKKIGKTVFAGTLSHHLSLQGVKHLFIGLEMDNEEIEQRCLSRALDIYPSAFRDEEWRGKTHLWANAMQHGEQYGRSCIYRRQPGGISLRQLQQLLTAAVYREKVTGFILDYWQLVGGMQRGESKADHLENVAQWIADFCRKHRLWAVVMGQLNQEGNTRGGEGARLAFDQMYEIKKEAPESQEAWLEMMETRYTKWANVGEQNAPSLRLNEKGPYFEQLGAGQVSHAVYSCA